MIDDPQHLNQTESRAGSTPHIARYVLAASMVLIVLIFAGLLLYWS